MVISKGVAPLAFPQIINSLAAMRSVNHVLQGSQAACHKVHDRLPHVSATMSIAVG
jgi:hypothetical protein